MDLGKLFKDEAFRKIVILFIVVKLLILATGYLGYFLIPAENSFRLNIVDSPLMNPWAQYDGRAFLDVAQNGYNNDFDISAGTGNYGWFPLYPLLIKIFSFVGYGLSAFLISNVFSLGAILLLYKLVRDEYGDKISEKTVLYLLVFPTSYFLSVMYAESIFLFLSLATFYFARKEKWLLAGAAGFLCALTRLQGALLLLPVAYLYLEKIKFDYRNLDKNCLSILLIPTGTVVFFTYLYFLTGNFFQVFTTLSNNYTNFSFPGYPFYREAELMLAATELKTIIYHLFNLFIAVSFSVLALMSLQSKYKIRRDYSLYALASVGILFFSSHFVSISRYVLVIFPAFIMLAKLQERNKYTWLEKALIALSVIMLVVLTIRHVNMHLDAYGL